MKTKVDKKTLRHIQFYCDNAEAIQWEDRLLTAMVHQQLAELGKRIKSKAHQESTTIKATAADLLAMQTLVGAAPSSSALIVREYFINPLMQQL